MVISIMRMILLYLFFLLFSFLFPSFWGGRSDGGNWLTWFTWLGLGWPFFYKKKNLIEFMVLFGIYFFGGVYEFEGGDGVGGWYEIIIVIIIVTKAGGLNSKSIHANQVKSKFNQIKFKSEYKSKVSCALTLNIYIYTALYQLTKLFSCSLKT